MAFDVLDNKNTVTNAFFLNNIKNIEYHYGIDKIHLYTLIQNVTMPRTLFLAICKRRKEINRIGFRIRRYNNNQSYLNITFSPCTLYYGQNLYSDVSIETVYFALTAVLQTLEIEIKNWSQINISRLDFFTNLIRNENYSKYDSIHKALNFKNTYQSLIKSTVYLYNESFRIVIYDKTEEFKKKQKNFGIGSNVTRIEFRLLNKKKILSALGKIKHPKTNKMLKVFPFCLLTEEQINTFMQRNLEQLTNNLSTFNFRPNSMNLEEELASYFTKNKLNKPSKVALRKAKEAVQLLEIYRSDRFLDFIKNNPKYSKIKKPSKKRINEYVFLNKKYGDLLSKALLIEHLISHGSNYIEEFIEKCRYGKFIAPSLY